MSGNALNVSYHHSSLRHDCPLFEAASLVYNPIVEKFFRPVHNPHGTITGNQLWSQCRIRLMGGHIHHHGIIIGDLYILIYSICLISYSRLLFYIYCRWRGVCIFLRATFRSCTAPRVIGKLATWTSIRFTGLTKNIKFFRQLKASNLALFLSSMTCWLPFANFVLI